MYSKCTYATSYLYILYLYLSSHVLHPAWPLALIFPFLIFFPSLPLSFLILFASTSARKLRASFSFPLAPSRTVAEPRSPTPSPSFFLKIHTFLQRQRSSFSLFSALFVLSLSLPLASFFSAHLLAFLSLLCARIPSVSLSVFLALIFFH